MGFNLGDNRHYSLVELKIFADSLQKELQELLNEKPITAILLGRLRTCEMVLELAQKAAPNVIYEENSLLVLELKKIQKQQAATKAELSVEKQS